MRNVKRVLSIFLTLALLTAAFVLPTSIYAEDEGITTVKVTENSSVRGNRNTTDTTLTGDVAYSAGRLYTQNNAAGGEGALRRIYLKFTPTADEIAKIKNAAYVALRVTVSDTELSGGVSKDAATDTLTVHGITGEIKSKLNVSTVTFNNSKTDGLEAYSNIVAKVTGLSGAVEADVTEYVKDETDGTYAFKLLTETLCGFYQKTNDAGPCLVIYDNMPADKQTAMEDAEALNVEKTVKKSFNLPVLGNGGSAVSWSSSDSTVISVDEAGLATVTQKENENTAITLTATVTKGNFTEKKTFGVVVLASNRMWAVTVNEDTYVRCGTTPTETGGTPHDKENILTIQELGEDGGACLRRTYLKFSLSENDKAKLNDADRITLKLQLTSDTDKDAAQVATMTVHGLTGAAKEACNISELTFNSTKTDGGLEYVNCPVAKVTGISDVCEVDVTSYVKSQTDGVYAFKLTGDNQKVIIFHSNKTNYGPELVAYDVADDLEFTINGAAKKLTDGIENGNLNFKLKVYNNGGAVNPKGVFVTVLYERVRIFLHLKKQKFQNVQPLEKTKVLPTKQILL